MKLDPTHGYTVRINEYQRLMLQTVLAHATLDPIIRDILQNEPGQIEENMLKEATTMEAMLRDMPAHDTEGLTHGLCL